jgi:hypothetical protein
VSNMVWNVSDDQGSGLTADAGPISVRVDAQPERQVVAQPEAQAAAQVDGSGGDGITELASKVELSPEEIKRRDAFDMFRSRLHDVPDPRIDQLILSLREGQSNRAVSRALVQEGYCPELNPATVRHYVARMRDALGLPGYEDPGMVAKEDDTDEPIEGQPAYKKLKWLTRIQSVRKALGMERLMGGMILPLATSEIKLLSDLIDKELAVALKTGEMKAVPEKVAVETKPVDTIVKTPADAFAVILAYRRLMKMKDQVLAAAGPEPEAE